MYLAFFTWAWHDICFAWETKHQPSHKNLGIFRSGLLCQSVCNVQSSLSHVIMFSMTPHSAGCCLWSGQWLDRLFSEPEMNPLPSDTDLLATLPWSPPLTKHDVILTYLLCNGRMKLYSVNGTPARVLFQRVKKKPEKEKWGQGKACYCN